MKTCYSAVAIVLWACLRLNALASVLYVDLNSTNPTPPYTNWSTAATNIQNAVDVSTNGDLVLVTNGVYVTGGRRVSGNATINRVAVTNAITVKSVNGPTATVIQGYQVSNPPQATRCVYLTDGATLTGFTLTGGGTQIASPGTITGSGGGVRCLSTNATVSDCMVVGNFATDGGGIASGTVNNCIFSNNIAQDAGGGGYAGIFNNCRFTDNIAANSGGGGYSGTYNNCLFTGNIAGNSGGGGCAATFNNCLFTGNSATNGGAASALIFAAANLNNCTVYGNSASVLGGGLASLGAAGASYLWASNCLVLGNTAPREATYAVAFAEEMPMNYCCTAPLPASGACNFTNDALFLNPTNGDFHLQSNSPCINAGSSNATGATDLDGNMRLIGGFVDLGAYEYQFPAPVPVNSSIQATYTEVSTGIVVGLTGQITGHATVSRWDFGDGTVISNQLPSISHSWSAPGDYAAALWAYNNSFPNGVSATVIIHDLANPMYYVSQSSTNPVAPFQSWDAAATNIQDAVDAAYIGGTVVVSNGVYATGGGTAQGGNRVAVNKQIAVRSVNGPAATTVDGGGSVRCFYLSNNAVVAGFTLTNGTSGGAGGGVYCASLNVVVSNCLIIRNASGNYGGGTYSGTFENCSFVGNAAMAAGGASDAVLNNCVLSNNVAQQQGGGAHQGTFNNCLLVGNSAPQGGAILVGSPNSTVLNNCTIYGNSASVEGGGIDSVWVTGNNSNLAATNCIIFGNNSPNGSNYNSTSGIELSFNHCCTTPLQTTGLGNITNDPAFVDPFNGNLHLQSNSPCINAGNNAYVSTIIDLDGNPRIRSATVDIGSYEYQTPSSVLSYAWAQQYGLPTDGTADYADTDGDGMNNWQEWKTGTIPTHAASVLAMLPPVVTNSSTGVTVSWQSVNTRTYYLQRATNLTAPPAFSAIQSNLAGQANATSFTDTTATNGGSYFYRVGVQ